MEKTLAEIEQGLQAFYGSDKKSRVSQVTLLGSGFETDVYSFSLDSEAGETHDLILRLYAGGNTTEKAAREFAAMSRLREAEYPVPQVLALHRESSPFQSPFLIMERVDGLSLERVFWTTPESQRQDVQTLFYGLMARLHALEGSDILPDAPQGDAADPYAFLQHELALLSELLTRLEGDEPPSLQAALTWLHSFQSTVPCDRFVVLHGDFHRNNILLRADGVPFVIDWSNIRLGDYRTDLAWTRLLTRADLLPDEGWSELDLYARLAGWPVANVAYFEVVACLRLLSSTLISLRFSPTRQGMRPEAEALMRRGAEHTRYVAALLQKRTGLAMPDLEEALSALFDN